METEKRLAEFISGTRFSELPQEPINAIKNIVLNLIGTTVAGSTSDGCEAIVQQVKEWGGKEEATILIHGGKVPACNAVLANAYMARALDIDDAMFPGMHVGASTVTTALAVAEMLGGCTGREFLTALVLGHEIAARMNSVAEYDGFDPTGISTVFGTATVAARLFKLNQEKVISTLAQALNRSAGSFQSNVDGALSVRSNQGFAAQGGVVSAQLAQKGINGPANFIEGVYGFLHLLGRDKHKAEEITGGLGLKYVFATNILFKKHPSCACTEGSTDAILYIMKEHGVTAESIDRIDITVSPYAYKLTGHDFGMGQNPMVNAQFSIQYCVASALIRGKSSLKFFEIEQIKDPKVQGIFKMIHIKPEPSLEGNIPLHLKTGMKITTKKGQVYQIAFDEPRGSPGNPLTREELLECFHDYVNYGKKRIPGENIDRITFLVDHLEEVKDIRTLIPLLLA